MGAAEGVLGMVDTRSGGSMGNGGNSVGNNLHQKKRGDSGTVGGSAANILGLHKGDKL